MKKIIGWIILFILGFCSIIIVKEKTEIYNISESNQHMEFKIRYKGLKGAVDFSIKDEKVYMAFPQEIMCIENGNEPFSILHDESLNITCIEIVNDNIYFISKNKLMSTNINTGQIKDEIVDIPNIGDYKEVLLKAYKENIFITIGSMTNSGIIGDDNNWNIQYPEKCDLSSEIIKLRENHPGAFVPKGLSNTKGQVIKANTIGNSSILSFNTTTSKFETFAWGIRNIKGIDITEEGKVFATVGGYEPRGERPIDNDSDYIYEIKKNHWYGFPDYSGGDSLDSPRFSSNHNKIKLLLEEYPMNPPAPYYQYNDTDSLKWIAIDNSGSISKSNQSTMFLYNGKNNTIYCGIIGSIFEPFVELNSISTATKMKIFNNKLYILDSNKGFLFTIEKEL